jgi:Winged helix DNA-binding domain
MRGTIHMVSARDYAYFAPATLPMVQRLYRSSMRDRQPVEDVEGLTARALAYAEEPRTGAELRDFLGGEDAWWRIRREALFVNAPGDEPWSFSRRRRFVAASAWLDRPLADVERGRDHLVRRYLAAFGPATAADVAAWSGLTTAELRPSLERVRLRQFRDERGRPLLDVPGAPLPDPRTPAPPRLLPLFDNTILSHADRTRVISDEHRQVVIRGGMVDATFLVDGFVAGVWRLRNGSVELEPFDRLSRSVERELRREEAAVEAFVA